MRYAVIGDVHEKYGQAKALYKTAKHRGADKVIFVGDFYDTYETLDLRRVGFTANTHADLILADDAEVIMGNHDMQYAFPHLDFVKCSGYNPFKHQVIDAHLNLEMWRKVQFYVWANGVLVSHAGIHPAFSHPVYGINEWVMGQYDTQARDALFAGQPHWFFMPGRSRGGSSKLGGITWLDFHCEFSPVDGLNQIVGHTASGPGGTSGQAVRECNNETSKNYCIDTGMRHIAFIEESGEITFEKVK